jgi:hypothetical protein
MALPGLFPIYPDPVPNKYQVSLSLPPLPVSKISESIGVTASAGFLVPNIDYLEKFIKGDIGIADKTVKEAMFKTFNNPIAQKDEKVFKMFSKVTGVDIPDINKYKKDGKIKLPKEEIKLPKMEGVGFKGFEQTMLTSIFETQKPYFEIAKLVIGNIAKIEDVVARVMPLLGVPLTTKSLKPGGNSGAGDRPKSIGYQGGKELKTALGKLQKISKQGSTVKIDKDGNATRDVTPLVNPNVTEGQSDNKNWQVVSTVYSTGVFKPGVQYKYIYIDLPPDKETPEELSDLNLEDDDPYNKYKPEKIILGIFKSDGSPLNPNEFISTIGMNGNNLVNIPTTFKKADWVLRSPKWHLPPYQSDNRPAIYSWPSFGTPTFTWVRYAGVDKVNSKTKPEHKSPGEEWKLKKYKKGDKNLITNEDAIEGNPVIVEFDTLETTEYKSYISDIVKYKMYQSEDLEQTEKDTYAKEIIGKLQTESHIENVYLYGQAKASVYKEVNNKPAYPDLMRVSFKPFQIYSASASQDVKLSAYNNSQGQLPGMIWIDPESDYETKVIRVDPTTNISFEESKGEPIIRSTIKSFVKNRATFNISNGMLFDLEISKNEEAPQFVYGVSSYVLENWNYYKANILSTDNPIIQNENTYSIKITSKTPNSYYLNRPRTEFIVGLNSAEVVSDGTNWSYREFIKINENKKYMSVSNGVKTLSDGSKVYVENEFITKWIYLEETYDILTLPTFGKDRTFSINYNASLEKSGYLPVSTSDVNISLYKINVTSNDFPYGKVIDPSKITNEQLTTSELFSKGKYGHGDADNPQEIEVIKRYMLTDLDTESYYIIEGILVDKNEQTDNVQSGSGSGSGYYKLPHAIGATKVFMSLLTDIFSKLIPQILKLIALFKNPSSFIIEIIKEKLGDGFSIFSKEAFDTFEKAKSIKDQKINEAKSTATDKANDANNKANDKANEASKKANDKANEASKKANDKANEASKKANDKANEASKKANEAKSKISDKINELEETFKNSPLSNYVFVDKKANYKFLLDGLAMLPFEIFGISLPFGAELNFNNIPNSPIKLIIDAKLSKVKNMQDFLMPKIKDFKGPGSKGVVPTDAGKLAPGLNISDIKSMESPIYKSNDKIKNDTDAVDIKYSTGEFINGVNYNYIYINQDVNKILTDADEILNTPNESVDLDKAKKTSEDLNDALKKDPTNKALKDALSKLKGKLGSLADSTQPLIKMLLGMVTIPIKIIGGIIEWLMKFFKGLTNPLTLPAKIAELLSFSWIMDIMSPIGLMKLIGIKFKPEKLVEWTALSKVPNVKVPTPKVPKIPNVKVPQVPGVEIPKLPDIPKVPGVEIPKLPDIPKVPGVEIPKLPDIPQVPDFDLKSLKYYKDASPKGRFLIPDDYDLVDLNEFFSAPFIAKLPTYTARQFRENPDRPLKLVLPTLCLFEKIINGIIDFIWSTLGIEALIPAPHIKLCSKSVDPDINDAIKLANDMNKTTSEPVNGGTFSNGNNGNVPTDADFLYDITLDNGTIVKGLNYEQMQKYVKDHENVGYDFKF